MLSFANKTFNHLKMLLSKALSLLLIVHQVEISIINLYKPRLVLEQLLIHYLVLAIVNINRGMEI